MWVYKSTEILHYLYNLFVFTAFQTTVWEQCQVECGVELHNFFYWSEKEFFLFFFERLSLWLKVSHAN